MKKALLINLAVMTVLIAGAQELVRNQNANFETSRDKYLLLADSLNTGQSTTSQQTYRAIDYLADKQAARDARRQFRQELRLQNARFENYYHPYSSYPRYYGRPHMNRWNDARVWGGVESPFLWYWLYR